MQVICRQLGFPFGSLYDVTGFGDLVNADYSDYISSSESGVIVWATELQCTGTEDRLDQCFFPELFGELAAARGGDYGFPSDDETGIRRPPCATRDGRVLGVVCRRFEIKGPVLCSCANA